jgi:hypothetical protein
MVEDRLLLVIATAAEGQGWWVTRRAARMLLQVMLEQIARLTANSIDIGHRDLFYAFKQEEAASKTPITNEPLAAITEQDLLTSLRYGSQDDGLVVIVLVGSGGKEQALQFDADSLVSLVGLLRSQIDQADWELSLDWPAAALVDEHLAPNMQ